MLTYEKVMAFFEDHLKDNEVTEIVKLRKGYMGIEWDTTRNEIILTEPFESPEEMRKFLAHSFLHDVQIVFESVMKRDATEQEKEMFKEKENELIERCV